MSTDASHPSPDLPAIDERLVAPGSGYEIIDGMVVPVPPALPPHATRQSKIASLLEAYTRSEYNVATEMLTRTSKIDDIAPDVSVFLREPDPVTGGRRLEELVVEIISTQTIANAATKAAKLSTRGVRRVFGIDLERGRLLEWSRELGTWSILDASADLEDPALALPLPYAALLDAGRTDDAVARALLAKRNPRIEESHAQVRAEGRAEGRIETLIEAVLAVLASRAIPISAAQRERIAAERDPARLARWLAAAGTCSDLTSLLAP